MAFAHPLKNLGEIKITKGMRVVDIGAGSGAYVFALSPLVADTGRVYAIDVQKELVEKLKTEAKKRRLMNVDAVWANAEVLGGTKLRDASVDLVVLSNILFQAEHKEGLLEEVRRILVPGGELLLIDWSDSFGGLGPQERDILKKDKARGMVLSVGFSLVKEFDAGDHHYGIIFKKQ